MARGKPVVLSTQTFGTRGEAFEHFRAMLKRYKPGDHVSDSDCKDLASLLERHPKHEEKIGVGISHFEVQIADYGTQCFRAVRTNGTRAQFLFHSCIAPETARG